MQFHRQGWHSVRLTSPALVSASAHEIKEQDEPRRSILWRMTDEAIFCGLLEGEEHLRGRMEPWSSTRSVDVRPDVGGHEAEGPKSDTLSGVGPSGDGIVDGSAVLFAYNDRDVDVVLRGSIVVLCAMFWLVTSLPCHMLPKAVVCI